MILLITDYKYKKVIMNIDNIFFRDSQFTNEKTTPFKKNSTKKLPKPSAPEVGNRELLHTKKISFNSTSQVPEISSETHGNKANNLAILANLCLELKNEGIPVEVPTFTAINHTRIQEHILKYYPEYLTDWKNFNELRNNQTFLPNESKEILNTIRKKIEGVFESHPFPIKQEMKIFAEDQLLMIRSTGKEDTEQLANAGGNLSIAGVHRNKAAISKAIGQVIASYHSELSLTQRLLVKDDISEIPFTPVLLQAMIGEKPDYKLAEKDIPVAGIIYTKEILGNTEGLTQIQAAYGHNEAVVNSQVPVDTFYVYRDGDIHQVVRPKPERLIANEGKDFFLQSNPENLVRKPALSQQQVKTLTQISQRIHDYFESPRDIEWIFDPAKNVFYIVQARPIVEKSKAKPSTVVEEDLEYHRKNIKIEPIVANNGAVVAVTSPDEYIYNETLGGAFSAFMKLEDANEIKVVIVKRPEAATSHYACTFREMGITVICCPKFEKHKKSLEFEQYFLIDSQQNKLYIADQFKFPKNSARLLNYLKYEQMIREGWHRHPIPAMETILQNDREDVALQNAYEILLKGHIPSSQPQSAKDIELLLEKIGSSNDAVSKKAVKDLLRWLFAEVKLMEKEPYLYEKSRHLLANAVSIGYRLIDKKRPHMERLHAAKRFEALLMQKSNSLVVNADSLFDLLLLKNKQNSTSIREIPLSKEEKKELWHLENLVYGQIKSVEKAANFASPLTLEEKKTSQAIYDSVNSRLLTFELKEQWREFSGKLLGSESRIANKELINMIQRCQKLQILEPWLNASFPKAVEKGNGNSIRTLEALKAEMNRSFDVIRALQSAQASMVRWKERESLWKDPANFNHLNQQMNDTLIKNIFEMSELYWQAKESDCLSKMILMSYLQSAVDHYDKAIKAMKGSPAYDDKGQQAENFKKMLTPYLEIMELWINKIPDQIVSNWARNAYRDENRSVVAAEFKRKAIDEIKKHMQQITVFDEKQLRPSPMFNMNEALINSGTYWSQEFGRSDLTHEDLFSLIHRNILAALSVQNINFYEKTIPSEIDSLVKSFAEFNVELNYLGTFFAKANHLATQFEYPNLVMKYNIPIKNHGASIDVVYNIITKNAQIAVNMMAYNHGNRINKMISILIRETLGQGLDFHDYPSYSDQNILSYSFVLDANDKEFQSKQMQYIKIFKGSVINTLGPHTGNWASTKMENLDKGDSFFWRKLWDNPKAMSIFRKVGTKELSEFFSLFYKRSDYRAILEVMEAYEIELIKKGKDDFENVVYTILKAFENQNPLINSFFVDAAQVIFDERAIPVLLKRPQSIWLDKSSIFPIDYITQLQVYIAKTIYQSRPDLLKKYLKFLLKKKQVGALEELYYNTKFSEDIRETNKIKRILFAIPLYYFIPGRPVSYLLLQAAEKAELSSLKEGDEVIVRTKTSNTYMAAIVENIYEDKEKLQVIIGAKGQHFDYVKELVFRKPKRKNLFRKD